MLPQTQLQATISFDFSECFEDMESQIKTIKSMSEKELKAELEKGGGKIPIVFHMEKIKQDTIKSIKISKTSLLSYDPPNPRHKWSGAAKTYLDTLPEVIDIKEIILEFHKILLNFYE
ncbi:MAG: hypothetical protein ACFFD2_30380 [Promethearchaeota archaeon]